MCSKKSAREQSLCTLVPILHSAPLPLVSLPSRYLLSLYFLSALYSSVSTPAEPDSFLNSKSRALWPSFLYSHGPFSYGCSFYLLLLRCCYAISNSVIEFLFSVHFY